MKILLLGEYSGLHKNLKEGLLELGHDVKIASTGDGWKKIDGDISLRYENKYLNREIRKFISPFINIKYLINNDIIQFVEPFVIRQSTFPNKLYLDYILKNNEKSFLSASGSDSYFWKESRRKLEYGPFEDSIKYDLKGKPHWNDKEKMFEYNTYLAKKVSGIIPIMYEYEVAYVNFINRKKTIAIPINIDNIEYKENKIKNNKLVVFHGLSRYGFKGTKYVEEAFDILSKKYPNDLELIIDGKMPLDKYLEVISKSNVIIDQTNSYSMGLNALFGLAMGKVVLGGAEPESLISLSYESCPTINIKPSASSIVEEVEKLIEKRNEIPRLGYEGRQFVEKYHNYIDIAQAYLDVWKNS